MSKIAPSFLTGVKQFISLGRLKMLFEHKAIHGLCLHLGKLILNENISKWNINSTFDMGLTYCGSYGFMSN